ncbi:MAG TPA: DUF1576 domain-containing protein [Clostridiaceae bacterium]|nr:DUF1576 domain-containing protein [Clostridiaceae bacterium]
MPQFRHIKKAQRVARETREIQRQSAQPPPLLGAGRNLWQRIGNAQHGSGYHFFLLYCLLLIALAFIVDHPVAIGRGCVEIILSPSHLITDYVAVGGLGATLLNSGMVTFVSLILLFVRRVQISGPIISALFTLSGFAFFGKNVLNSVPILLGSLVYAKISRIPFSQISIVSLFATALSPLVSMLWLGVGLPLQVGVPLGIFIGLLVGFISPPLASSFLLFHRGYNLYNVGFTAGIIGMVFTALLRMFDVELQPVLLLSTDQALPLGLFISGLSLFLIGVGLWRSPGAWQKYPDILTQSGRLVTDFTKIVSVETTFINMGLMGLLGCGYVVLLGGPINGPVIGAILTVIGFAAFGVQPKNAVPVMVGVALAAITNQAPYNDTTAILAALFGTTLAPLAGHYGSFVGIIAGFTHMAIVLNVGYLHGGINLYNNGFSGGFVAAFMVPLLEDFNVRKQKRKKR